MSCLRTAVEDHLLSMQKITAVEQKVTVNTDTRNLKGGKINKMESKKCILENVKYENILRLTLRI